MNLADYPDSQNPLKIDWSKVEVPKDSKLSCYIVCKDERHFIELAVRSVAPFVDDLVVVDTGSKDGTRDILDRLRGEFPVLKYHERAIRNFDLSEIRNWAVEQCRYDQIFVCDGDEVYDEEEILKIRKWFELSPYTEKPEPNRLGARFLSVRPLGTFAKAEQDIYMVRAINRKYYPRLKYQRIWPADDLYYDAFPVFVKLPFVPIHLFHLASVKPYGERLKKWATYHALSFWEQKIKESEIPEYFSMADFRETAKGVNHVSCEQAPARTIPIPKILIPHVERIEKEAAK